MNGLLEYFRERIPAKITALELARDGVAEDPQGAAESIRRIAHSLRGSAGSFGFPQISAAAGLVESAGSATLAAALDGLLDTLKAAIDHEVQASEVLIVSGDTTDTETIAGALRHPARAIVTAGSGEEALELLRSRPIGLVIVDLVLPDRDGRSLLLKIREDPRTAAIPVFALSSLASDRVQAECLALGAQRFVEKPVKQEILAAAVTATLELAGNAAERWAVDPLTALPNRAAFNETYRRAAAYAWRNNRPVSLGILDLDHFKRVNDLHGHGVGDEVLQRTAQILGNALRQSDSIARWGGEEFVVLLPDTSERGGVRALEKAQLELARVEFSSADGRRFNVTFSAGVTRVRANDTLSEALTRADRELYRAKAAGRNRVFCEHDDCELPHADVLLVEDDDSVATLIEDRLSSVNLRVVRCREGREALDRLAHSPVSIGILDVNMPGMDGFTLLRRLRALPSASAMPVVMLTGRGSEEDVVRGFELGADDYIVKPFSPTELTVRIHRLLKRA